MKKKFAKHYFKLFFFKRILHLADIYMYGKLPNILLQKKPKKNPAQVILSKPKQRHSFQSINMMVYYPYKR